MDWNLFIPLSGLVVVIGGGFAAFGRISNKVENLGKELAEEKARNSEQHKEFYSVKESAIKMGEKMEGVGERLREVEIGIKEILSRLPPHRRAGED
jgi:hypothetical protein